MEHHAAAPDPGNVIDLNAYRLKQRKPAGLSPLPPQVETKPSMTETEHYRLQYSCAVWLQANAQLMVGG